MPSQDDLYLHHLIDACHDAVRRLLGPRKALTWNRHVPNSRWPCPSKVTVLQSSFRTQHCRETTLAAQILYHGTTTGCGVQTLGEEYCDILQVNGKLLIGHTLANLKVQQTASIKVTPWTLLGRVGVAPAVVRRGLLVLLQTLLPYMVDRLGTSAESSRFQDDSADWLHASDADTSSLQSTSESRPAGMLKHGKIAHQHILAITLSASAGPSRSAS